MPTKGNHATVVSINTEVEQQTPEQMKARFAELLEQQKEFNALKSKLAAVNEGRTEDLRYEIYFNRELAKPYQEAEKTAYDELLQLSAGNLKVKFSEKEREKFAARFTADKKAGKFS
jgi:hypothetical protein